MGTEPARAVEAVLLHYDLADHGTRPIHDGSFLNDLAHDAPRTNDWTLDDHLAHDLARGSYDAAMIEPDAGGSRSQLG